MSETNEEPGGMRVNQSNPRIFILRQIKAISGPLILTFVSGLIVGFAAVLVDQITAPDSTIAVTVADVSLMSSIPMLATIGGSLAAGFFIRVFGARKVNMACAPLMSIFWLLYLVADNIGLIIGCRFFTGLLGGLAMASAGVYIMETTDPKFRGMFLSLIMVGNTVGVLIMHVAGRYLKWKYAAIFVSVFPLLNVVAMFFAPETPVWLIRQDEKDKGKRVFRKLRGETQESERELSLLLQDQNEDNTGNNLSGDKMAYLKSIGIICLLSVTSQWSGFHTIEYYSITLAKAAFGGNGYSVTVIIDVTRISFTVIGCVLSKYVNRKPHITISGIGGGVAMLIFTFLLYYRETFGDINIIVILFMLLVFIGFITVGLGTVPAAISGEIIPQKYRAVGFPIAIAILSVTSFVSVLVGPFMFNSLGGVPTFATFGVISLSGTIALHFVLPETKGNI